VSQRQGEKKSSTLRLGGANEFKSSGHRSSATPLLIMKLNVKLKETDNCIQDNNY
jgi:hypothetical protein